MSTREPRNIQTYIAFDIETTGFSPVNDRITEIAAVKLVDGVIVGIFQELVNPQIPIPVHITEITGITDDMVACKRAISEVLPDFLAFCSDETLVAHNAPFDVGFIRHYSASIGLAFNNDVVDTLAVAHKVLPYLPNHKLETVANALQIKPSGYHRALDDAKTVAAILEKLM